MENKVSFFKRYPIVKDFVNLIVFVACVIIGTMFLNAYVFRSYNVVGHSMDYTLSENDRLIVNRLAVSMSHLSGKEYVPERGQIIVFLNGESSGKLTCNVDSTIKDQYIIKRVIAFPGERVVVKDGKTWLVTGSPGGSRIITTVLQKIRYRWTKGQHFWRSRYHSTRW